MLTPRTDEIPRLVRAQDQYTCMCHPDPQLDEAIDRGVQLLDQELLEEGWYLPGRPR